MTRYLLIVIGGALIASCSSPQQEDPSGALRMPPKEGQPTASDVAQRSVATQEDVKNLLDLDEYPNAATVENSRLTSEAFAPD